MISQNPPAKGSRICSNFNCFHHPGGWRRADPRSGAPRTPQKAYVLQWFQRATAYPPSLRKPMFSYRNIDTFEGSGQRDSSEIHLEHPFKAEMVTFWEGSRAHAESHLRNSWFSSAFIKGFSTVASTTLRAGRQNGQPFPRGFDAPGKGGPKSTFPRPSIEPIVFQ